MHYWYFGTRDIQVEFQLDQYDSFSLLDRFQCYLDLASSCSCHD